MMRIAARPEYDPRLGLLLALALISPAPAADSSSSSPPWTEVAGLNPGLPADDTIDLSTPQSAVEGFLEAGRARQYLRAAHALNLNDIPAARQVELGPRLAHELIEIMDQQVWFRWREVPDRPDGQQDEPIAVNEASAPPKGPQSNFLLYRLYIGEHDYEIRLERVKPPKAPPAWVFSRQTVRHIPVLYRQFQPTRLARSVPAALRDYRIAKVALWQWIGFAVLLAAGVFFAWAIKRAMHFALRWLDYPWVRVATRAIEGPGAAALGLWLFYSLTKAFLGLAGPVLSVLHPFYVAIICICLIWFLQRLIRLITARLSATCARCDSDEGNVRITRLSAIQHVLVSLVIIGGGVYALSGFEVVQRFGAMILASAGVAGLILGIAAQRVLGNLFAGVLLAIVQPVKAGDAIIFEGDFGWIEEISMTYLVIRTWDQRRLIAPFTYFMDHPFQNWSRGSLQIIGTVLVYADYRVEVEAVRKEFQAILESTELWDRQVPPILHVVDCKDDVVALRGLCSARDPAASWDLRCLVRERLIAFLREWDQGRYLPRRRIALVDEPAPPDGRDGQRQAVAAGHNGDT